MTYKDNEDQSSLDLSEHPDQEDLQGAPDDEVDALLKDVPTDAPLISTAKEDKD